MAVAKVFTINLTGGQAVQKSFDDINKSVKDTSVQVKVLKEQLAAIQKVNASDASIAGLKQQIKELELAQKSLSATQRAAETDIKNQILLEKGLADVKLKEAQATKVQEQANQARVASQIQQEKELDRQIALEAKEEAQLRKTALAANALPGSYLSVVNALKQLRPLIQAGNESSTIQFQGKQVNFSQAIAEYTKLSAAEQAFRRQFQADGTLVSEYSAGIVNAFKRLNIDDIIKSQVSGARQQIQQLETQTQGLVVAYRAAQQEGSQDLGKLQGQIHANVVETQNLKQAIVNAEGQLKGIGGVGNQITSTISSGFQNLKTSIAQFALTYFGFFAAFNEFRKAVVFNAQLSDSFAQLQIYLHGTKEDVDALFESLKKIPTRTSIENLVDIATIVAKKGVAKQEIQGVTQALDQLFVVLGTEVGDPHEAVSSLVKLVNVYSEDKHVTAKNIGDIGAAIQKLTSSGVATGSFLINFAERLAGVRGITGVSIQNVLGLGAAIQELGQRSETAGTAASQLIIKLFADIPKYAGFAGKSVQEFTKTVTENPVEALIQLAEGLKKNKAGLAEVAQAFDAAGIHGARVLGVLGDIAGNADYMRKRVADATLAFGDQGSILAANEIKQKTFAASLDLIKKKFELLGTSKAFQITLAAIVGLISLLIANIPALLTILGVLSVSWAVQNSQLIALNLQLLYYNTRILLNYTAIGLLTVAMNLNRLAILLLNGAVTLATKGFQLLGIAIKSTPFGIIVAVLGTLAGLFIGLQHAMAATTAELSNQALRLKAIQQIQQDATKAIADQVAKLNAYAAVVRDTSISEQTRLKALQDLIAINPAFSKALQGNKIDIGALNEVLKEYNGNLLKKAELEAAQSLQQKEFQKLVDLQSQKQGLEIAKAQGTHFGDLSDDQKGLFSKITTSVGRTAFTSDLFNLKIKDSDFAEAFKDLDKQIKAQSANVDATTQVFKDKYQKAATVITTGNQAIAEAASPDQVDIDIEALKAQLAALDNQIDKFKGNQKDLNALIKQRSDLQDKLDKILGVQHGGAFRGSRLTGDQKDFFKDIDAIRDQQLAAENLRHEQGLDDEKTYLTKILAINEDALNKKIAHLKGVNAQERKLIAEFQLEKIKLEKETNQKLFDIDNKKLEGGLQQKNAGAKISSDTSLSNPDLTNTEQVQLQEDYLNQLLQNQIKFNQDQENLEKKYGIHSIENENKRKEAISKIIDELIIKRRSEPEAALKDIQQTGDKAAAAIKTNLAKQISAILDQDLSPTETAKKITAAQVSAQESLLANQVATDKISLDKTKQLLDKKLVSQKQYYDALEKYQTDQAALDQLTTNQQLSNIQKLQLAIKEFAATFTSGLLGIKQYTNDAAGNAQRIKDVIADVQKNISQAATEAYNNYFKNQADQIDRETKAQDDFLDRQRTRVTATADSQEEIDTINRQFDQKKKDADRKAFEEKKKLALKQATIDFALAAIKTFATYGWPLGLIGVAGLAIAYGIQRAAINAQQFAKGGQVKNLSSGKITAPGNIKSLSNGDNMLATVRTGEVILNQRQQHALGGPRTFAAIGVPGFASGGLGTSLRAPQFISTGSSFSAAAGDASDRMDRLEKLTEGVLQAVYASDNKPVTLVPKNVTKAQARSRKDVSIATI